MDVSEYEQVRMSVERIMAEFERIDVFFSNAGVAGLKHAGQHPGPGLGLDHQRQLPRHGLLRHGSAAHHEKQATDAYFLFTVSIGGLQPGMRIRSAYTASSMRR